jgi:hypothetical protein
MNNHAKTALSLALAIVGGIAAGMRCDASVTVETPTQINPRVAAYTVRAYTEGSDPFVPWEKNSTVVIYSGNTYLTLSVRGGVAADNRKMNAR